MIYLYVKKHNKTGLCYLGKTTSKDPHKYQGSGKYWKLHLQKHGYDCTTEILLATENKEEIKEAGLYYSDLWSVVDSDEWANLKPEEGDGITSELAIEINRKRVKDRSHNFLYVGPKQKELYEYETHNFQIHEEKRRKNAKNTMTEKIENGTFHLSSGNIQRNSQLELSAKGNHNFQSKDVIENSKKKYEEGTHNFQIYSEKRKENARKATQAKEYREKKRKETNTRVSEGSHNLLGSVTCRDKNGTVIQINKEIYHKQTGPKENWEYVSINSKEGKKRKKENGIL